MQTWLLCCQLSGMLSKLVLCHVCKHAVKFLEASNAQYLYRSAVKLPAINLMSLGQISHTVCALNAEFVSAQQILSAETRRISCQWDSHLWRAATSIPPCKILHKNTAVLSSGSKPKTGVRRKHKLNQPEDCFNYKHSIGVRSSWGKNT